MSNKQMKNGFTAEKCNFQGVPGYMLHQRHDGVCVCSQFIPAEAFRGFCDAAGIEQSVIVFID